MNRYPLTVTPHSSLYIGGYARALGESDGDTAADAGGMLIPGSAVKGALREAAVRLVNGAGRGKELVVGLFGKAEEEGAIRITPLRAAIDGDGEAAPSVDPVPRHHVSLVRATRQAAPGRLFQNRVTAAGHDLGFRGELMATRDLEPDEEGLLRSVLQLTDQIGGGRGRGLGLVTVELGERRQNEARRFRELPQDAKTMVLVLAAEEPLQLGVIKDLSNVSTSKGYLDGSAVRGAVAATLESLGLGDRLESLLGGPTAARFGNGYPGNPSAIPAPLTLRESKIDRSPADDALRLSASVAGGEAFRRAHDRRAAKGSFAHGCTGWAKIPVTWRMVTRTARNLVDGRAADGQLFSLEVVEPTLGPSPALADPRLRFYVPVSGRREQLELAVRAAAAGLVVGSTRTRGFGRLALDEVSTGPPLEPLEDRHRRWAERLRALGVEDPERTGVLLALGPVAVDQERLVRALAAAGLELRHGVSRRQAHGGWNRKVRLPRGVSSHFVPGSTWIVESRDGDSAAGSLAAIEQQGIGPGRPDGWGFLVACHPIHVDCFEEDRA